METPKPPPGLVAKTDSKFTRGQRHFIFFIFSVLHYYRNSVIACLLVLAVHTGLAMTPFFSRFENIAYDFFVKVRGGISVHPGIVMIEIDENSVLTLGQRWPWPREMQAVLAHFLTEWGAKAIVFDIIYSEKTTEFSDGAFEEAMAKSKNVYFPVVLEGEKGYESWTHSLPNFEKYARGVGHINIRPDGDGILRHIQPLLEGAGQTHPHLAVKAAYDFLGRPVSSSLKELDLPLDEQDRLLVNWAGTWKDTFIHYSFIQLLQSFKAYHSGGQAVISPDKIKDKICVIGLTATGSTDIKANPLEVAYPAVGLHANVINSILTGQFVRPFPRWANALCVFMMGILALVFFIPFRNIASVISAVLLIALWEFFAFQLFAQKGIWLYGFQPILVIPSLLIVSAVCAMTIAKKEQTKLFHLATRDGLTGVYTIRHFKELLNQCTMEACIKKQPVSLLLMDLDNFKKINDTYGHIAGDMVIKGLAEVLQVETRQRRSLLESDVVARYGGEEFIVMLRKCTLTDASFKVGERVRKGVENYNFMWEGKRLTVTVSIGVATLRPHENVPDLMVRRADDALYRAKNTGKNRVCIESD